MAHELDFSRGRAAMAYTRTGGTPWHGLGAPLPDDASLEEWRDAAGFDWQIEKAPVTFIDRHGITRQMPDRFVLHRSDTGAPLSVMSGRYREVQPAQVLDFFADVCESQRWTMETAGVLKGGAQYWALAKAGLEAFIDGTDHHELYMLLATSADGSLATLAQATDVRVVCANTLGFALNDAKGKRVTVRHNTLFDAQVIKRELGMVDFDASWDAFIEQMKTLQQVEVNEAEARTFFSELLRPSQDRPAARGNHQAETFEQLLGGSARGGYTRIETDRAEPERAIRGLEDLMTSYHTAPGAAPGSAYGLVQGVTHWLDHVRGPDQGRRLSSTWFGQGARLKDAAVDAALKLAA
ncbi:MAG: DUF932 domain-containing protein [Gammaproteobacteria bacterium]|nr:DUF932 domain-containing protein [Gammaproteobacteria bacterium]